MVLAAIFLGGGFGAVVRYGLQTLGHMVLSPHYVWPWGTFAINILGGFGIGLVYVMVSPLLHPAKSQNAWAFWGIGVMGGFTTFSAFSMEAYHLLERKGLVGAVIYVGLTVFLSIGAFALGAASGRGGS